MSASKSGGSLAPRSASSAAYMSFWLKPRKRSPTASASSASPIARSASAVARQAMTSLSTRTPSQSKMTRSKDATLLLGVDIDGHARLVFGRPDGQGRAHMGDVGRRRQPGGEKALIVVPVGGDDLQEKVGLAGQHVRFAHLGPGQRQCFESL